MSYRLNMTRRIVTAVVVVIALSGAISYVAVDRARVATHIHARKLNLAACLREHPLARAVGVRATVLRREQQTVRTEKCYWSTLVEVRDADLYGLPFFALAIGLSLILVESGRRTARLTT